MSEIYLIRHGQAGTRLAYDELSPLGHIQARRAGEYLAGRGVRFRAALSGCLRRQRETAAEVAGAYAAGGIAFPEVLADPGWNEFDLEAVYRDVAGAMAADDPAFRREYAELMRLAADGDDEVHRRWSPCDAAIVNAWIAGRYSSSAGTWEGFIERVEARRNALPAAGPDDAVAVFSSAVPIGIWVAMALGVSNGSILRLAGVLYNTSISTVKLSGGELHLFDFNGSAHLADPALRTFR